MMDPTLAEFLRACVRAEKNIMIAGGQAAGKTTLLRALLKEIDPDERFATIETEFELFAHDNGFHRQVVPMGPASPTASGSTAAAPARSPCWT